MKYDSFLTISETEIGGPHHGFRVTKLSFLGIIIVAHDIVIGIFGSEKAATPSMIKHGLSVRKQATECPNAGQIHVTALDQPIFAFAMEMVENTRGDKTSSHA